MSRNRVRAEPATNSAPQFPPGSVTGNTPAGRNIGEPFQATDVKNDILTYTLDALNPNVDAFTISETSGQLLTKAPLDYDTTRSYSVQVTATDPSDASDTIRVTINLLDEDETPEVDRKTSIDYYDPQPAFAPFNSLRTLPPGGTGSRGARAQTFRGQTLHTGWNYISIRQHPVSSRKLRRRRSPYREAAGASERGGN